MVTNAVARTIDYHGLALDAIRKAGRHMPDDALAISSARVHAGAAQDPPDRGGRHLVPSPTSSPWIRRCRRVGFSCARQGSEDQLRTRARAEGRPGRLCG